MFRLLVEKSFKNPGLEYKNLSQWQLMTLGKSEVIPETQH